MTNYHRRGYSKLDHCITTHTDHVGSYIVSTMIQM